MQENVGTGTDDNVNETLSAREKLQLQLRMFGTVATMVANQGLVKTARISRPLIRGYVGCEEFNQIEDDFSHGDVSPNRLTNGEKALLMTAGVKMASELMELATRAYPPTQGIQPYQAVKGEDGCYPAPHLAHVLSLGKAAQELLGEQLGAGTSPDLAQAAEVASKQPVLLTALNNDEFGFLTSPIEPRTIRRVALGGRERIVNRGNQTPRGA